LKPCCVLSRKQRATPAVPKIFDGEKEARLIALACSEPPKGYFRWTLRLLALPAGLGRVKVRLRYRRHILDIEVDRDLLRIRSRPFTANPITVAYRGHFRNVAPGDAYEFHLFKPEELDRDENRNARGDGRGAGGSATPRRRQ
jgi:Glycosyl hydrolase family 65, C-terminal domain